MQWGSALPDSIFVDFSPDMCPCLGFVYLLTTFKVAEELIKRIKVSPFGIPR